MAAQRGHGPLRSLGELRDRSGAGLSPPCASTSARQVDAASVMRRLCAQFAWRSDIVPLRRRLHRVLIAEPASRCWRSQASAWLRPIILVAHPTVHAGLGSATRHVRRDRDRPEILRVFEPDDRPPTQFQHRDERRRHGRCRAARMAGLRHLPCKLGSRVNPADDPTPRSAGVQGAAVGDDIRGMKMIDPWALGPEICVTGVPIGLTMAGWSRRWVKAIRIAPTAESNRRPVIAGITGVCRTCQFRACR